MASVGASSASATILEKEGGAKMVKGEELDAVIQGFAQLHFGFETVDCGVATIKGVIKDAGGFGAEVIGETTAVIFSSCKCEPIVATNGMLEIHSIAGTPNGRITVSGLTFTIICKTIFGTVTCKYITGNGNHVGTLTGSNTTKSTAQMDISASLARDEGSSGLCAEVAEWDATYQVEKPDELNVTEK